jgi:hypothetical protein
LKQQITGKRPDGRYFKTVTRLGRDIANGGFSAIAGVDAQEILMPYDK